MKFYSILTYNKFLGRVVRYTNKNSLQVFMSFPKLISELANGKIGQYQSCKFTFIWLLHSLVTVKVPRNLMTFGRHIFLWPLFHKLHLKKYFVILTVFINLLWTLYLYKTSYEALGRNWLRIVFRVHITFQAVCYQGSQINSAGPRQ